MTPDTQTQPTGNRSRKWRALPLLAALGPGIIAASAGNDAGGIATYSAAGASYGYATLWMIFVMTFSLVIVLRCACVSATSTLPAALSSSSRRPSLADSSPAD